ncbi:MAG: hypothetical protein P4L63_02025 [Candidatus Pacebacteria bacterium]|nr:hypothetical protein [Candidatus Paceibacterota bacterium]
MTNQQLLDFIRQQLSKGLPKEKITSDLLANGWTAQDIQEGFSAIVIPAAIPPITPSVVVAPVSVLPSTTPNTFIPPSYKNINQPITSSPVQIKKHSGGKMFFLVLVLFLLAGGGVSAYYYKDKLVNLPIIKKFFPSKVITPTEPQAVVTTNPITIPTPTTSPITTQPPTQTTPIPTPTTSVTPTPNTPISTITSNNGITQLVGTLVSVSGNTIVVSNSGNNWYVDITNATFIPQIGKNPVRYRILVGDQLGVSGIANTTAFTMIANKLQDFTQQEVSIQANLNNIRAEAASFQLPQSTPSYSGFCLSKQGEVGLNQLKEIGGTNLVCKDSEKTFAVGVNFSNPNSENWCVDSVSPGHTTSVFLSGALCP